MYTEIEKQKIEVFRNEIKQELLRNILPFWMKSVDLEYGGFLGRITGKNESMYDANKGGVLNARILWTFSAAYRQLKDQSLLSYATRAKDFLLDYFLDKQFGGIYWMLNHQGNLVNTKKQIYALGFAIYGLSEYHRATGDTQALEVAIDLFHSIEQHSYDVEKQGYYEAFAADWSELDDVRLSTKDANEKKTMNTHLHILEPYTNLYRVWKSPELEMQIRNLIEVFLNKILNPETYHLDLFFNEDWESKYNMVSYGHDIEASWLLHEAALVLGDADLTAKVEAAILRIAVTAEEGLQSDGSMAYELNLDKNHLDTDRHWWVQAETVVGYINAWQYTKDVHFLHLALHCWEYIKKYLIDHQAGEWFWGANEQGEPDRINDKLGPWKCPYHNARMCLEILERNLYPESE